MITSYAECDYTCHTYVLRLDIFLVAKVPTMPTTYTADQITALAPDTASAQAGKGLASPRKWVSLGADERAIWGECQGSGKTPYRTQIDLAGPAFRCSCPSRKFPCKHGIGLFLLLAHQPEAFTEHTPPAWVTEWLSQREQKTQQREEKPKTGATTRQRANDRHERVAAGMNDLARWMHDLVRQGLASAQTQPHSFWEAPAARMVDAQAPGVARLLRELRGMAASGEGWQDRLLERVGRLHLLIEGFTRLDTLPEGVQADIRTAIGWTHSREDLLAAHSTRGQWQVVGQHTHEEDTLRVQRTWLWAEQAHQSALILEFAPLHMQIERTLFPGTSFDAELVFYPSAHPLRAIVKERYGIPHTIVSPPTSQSISEATRAYAQALARNPWIEQFPFRLDHVVPVRHGDHWEMRDASGQTLPITTRFEQGWQLLAVSGGYPLTLYGEWDGKLLLPLSAWANGKRVGFS